MAPRRIHVLLVEDDEDDYFLTTDLLEQVRGTAYEVSWISNPGEALIAMQETEFDVCLLDYRLGAQTGLDVLHAMQGLQLDIPCILLTGQSDAEIDRAAMEAGATDYLVKGELDAPTIERAIRYSVGNAQTLRSLRESEERFRGVVEAATDGIALLDRKGRILTWNDALITMLGRLDKEMVSDRRVHFSEFLTERSGQAITEMFSELPPTGTIQRGPIEAAARRLDGSEFPVEISVSSWVTTDQGRLWSAIFRDVTERKILAEQLVHQAYHDPLTNLANRTLFRDRVEQGIRRLARRPGEVAVLFLDLDEFKRVNDTLGHDAGDRLLTNVAERLLGCIRDEDTVARLGGDEFAICVEYVEDTSMVLQVASRILTSLARAFDVDGRSLEVTSSIGIALTGNNGAQAEELLRNADVAMYVAKSKGKNRYEVFADEMHRALLDRMQLESDLRLAIDRGEIELYYQPLFRLDDGTLKGFEALARWNHPTLGQQSPAVFISLAEETGLIGALGRAVLREAVRQTGEWQQRYPRERPITMAVNLSSKQLSDHGFMDVMVSSLDTSGMAEGTLILEVTESVMVGDVDVAIELLNKLRDNGARLALDDFGTGYSSLSYLHLLPLDIVKVDRSFISNSHTETGAALIRAIAALSASMDLETVAEGIETEVQQGFVASHGYTYGQGFLFSRPLPAAEAEQVVSENRVIKFENLAVED